MMFINKHIVVGVCGGIAAYKAAGLVSQLRQRGADVHCIMTCLLYTSPSPRDTR